MQPRYFEDFSVGEEFRTRFRTITETDLVAFAGLTGDYTYLHSDAEAAKATPFGQRIAHGAMIYSYSIGLMTQLNLLEGTVIAFYGLDRLRAIKPTFIGDTIHVQKRVAALRLKDPSRGLIEFETSVVNQHGQAVMVYTGKVLVQTRNLQPIVP
jgi:acyl dehydratase